MERWLMHHIKKLPRSHREGLAWAGIALLGLTALLYLAVLLRTLRVLRRMDRALGCYIQEHDPRRRREPLPPEDPRT